MYPKMTTDKAELITFQQLVHLHTPAEESREKPRRGLLQLSQIMPPTEENRDLRFWGICWDPLGRGILQIPAICKATVQFLVLKVK